MTAPPRQRAASCVAKMLTNRTSVLFCVFTFRCIFRWTSLFSDCDIVEICSLSLFCIFCSVTALIVNILVYQKYFCLRHFSSVSSPLRLIYDYIEVYSIVSYVVFSQLALVQRGRTQLSVCIINAPIGRSEVNVICSFSAINLMCLRPCLRQITV